MKNTRTALILLLAGAVTFTTGLWVYNTMEPISIPELILFGCVGVIVIFSVYIGIQRYRRERRGLAVEDELSKRIMEKAASKAFGWSIYMWTFVCMFAVDSGIRAELVLGAGILGMGLIYISFWVYYNRAGIESAHD